MKIKEGGIKMDQVKCGKGIESLYNIIEGTYSRKCLINNQTLDINIVKNQESEDSVQWEIIKTEKKMKKFTGHGIKSLFLKLNEMFTEMTFSIVPEVLCLVRATKKEVRYVICAMDDADLTNGRINFEVLDVNVTPYDKHHSTVKDACQLAQDLNVDNLILYHTEDKNISRRKELYTEEGRQYYKGNLLIPDDLETFEL